MTHEVPHRSARSSARKGVAPPASQARSHRASTAKALRGGNAVMALVDRLKRELQTQAAKAQAQAERLDAIAYALQGIQDDPARAARFAGAFDAALNESKRGQHDEHDLKARAKAGLRNFTIERQPSGGFQADLDGIPVPLAPTLGIFLQILAADTGPTEDGMVSWKNPKDIVFAIERVAGRPFRPSALDQLLSRLRGVLWRRAHLHKSIIDRIPQLGMRLRLWRSNLKREAS